LVLHFQSCIFRSFIVFGPPFSGPAFSVDPTSAGVTAENNRNTQPTAAEKDGAYLRQHSADYAVAICPSVRLSVRHTPVFYRNG